MACSANETVVEEDIVDESTVQEVVENRSRTLTLRVSDFPPQYYLDEYDNWRGLDVELGKALVEEAGYVAEFVELPWSRALESIKEGRIDIMMNLSITPEREEFLNFLGPERAGELVLVVNEIYNQEIINNLKDLIAVAKKNNMKIGLQDNVAYTDELMQLVNNDDYSDYFEYATEADENMTKTAENRIIGFFEDKVSMKYKIEENPDYKTLMIHSYILKTEYVYFGITKKIDGKILNDLNDAFNELVDDGTFEKIRNKYY